MTKTPHVWQTLDLSKKYLEGIRGGIPLAGEQLDVILRIVRKLTPEANKFLDVGCGDGILGRTLTAAFPQARCAFLDFSEHMLAAARAKADAARSDFFHADFGDENWHAPLKELAPFDAVVSGLAIHHQPDERKRAIYADVFNLLRPGGVFLHLEHVLSASAWANEIHEEIFIDSIFAFHQSQGSEKTRAELAYEFGSHGGRAANILAPLETQCDWLREIGFQDVDCFVKLFELTVFGGKKPE